MINLNLASSMEVEGKSWKFIGILSKNREEWYVTNWANMH